MQKRHLPPTRSDKRKRFCPILAKEFKNLHLLPSETSRSLVVTTQHMPGSTVSTCCINPSLAISLEWIHGIPQPKEAEKGGLTHCRNYLSRLLHAGRSPVHTSPHNARPAAASWGPGRRHSDQRPGSSSNSQGGTHLAQGKHTEQCWQPGRSKTMQLRNQNEIHRLFPWVAQGVLALEWVFIYQIISEGLNVLLLYLLCENSLYRLGFSRQLIKRVFIVHMVSQK